MYNWKGGIAISKPGSASSAIGGVYKDASQARKAEGTKYHCQDLDNTADQVADKLAGLGALGTTKCSNAGHFRNGYAR